MACVMTTNHKRPWPTNVTRPIHMLSYSGSRLRMPHISVSKQVLINILQYIKQQCNINALIIVNCYTCM